MAGHRVVADPDLRSVHFGDPQTLKAVFFGELWRGRDNLRVTFSGPRGLREWRSALIPIGELALLTSGVVALLAGHVAPAVAFWLAALAPSAVRAAGMVRRQLNRTVIASAQALAVAIVFDLARALALVTRVSHRARRVA